MTTISASPETDDETRALVEWLRLRPRGREALAADLIEAQAGDIARLRAANAALISQGDETIREEHRLRLALSFYANPKIYEPRPEGLAFEDRDLSFHAKSALSGLSISEDPTARAERAEAQRDALMEAVKPWDFALRTLEAYEAEYGELDCWYQLGRIDDSRGMPSFRIYPGHVRNLGLAARAALDAAEGSDARTQAEGEGS